MYSIVQTLKENILVCGKKKKTDVNLNVKINISYTEGPYLNSCTNWQSATRSQSFILVSQEPVASVSPTELIVQIQP